MANIDRAAEIIEDRLARWEVTHYEPNSDYLAWALADTGLLAPDPQIIRTVEELEALHSSTVVWSREAGYLDVAHFMSRIESDPNYADDLPAVVIRDGAGVRAARKAWEEA